jgi:hypothetical protein
MHPGDRVYFVKYQAKAPMTPAGDLLPCAKGDVWRYVAVDAETPVNTPGQAEFPREPQRKLAERADLSHFGPCPAHAPDLSTEDCLPALASELASVDEARLLKLVAYTGHDASPAGIAAIRDVANWRRDKKYFNDDWLVERMFKFKVVGVFDPNTCFHRHIWAALVEDEGAIVRVELFA